MNETNLIATINLEANSRTVISNRVGVWHGSNVSKATVDRSSRARLNGLLVLKAWISEVNMHINEARSQYLALCINNGITLLRCNGCCYFGNSFSIDTNVQYRVKIKLRVYNTRALKQKCHQSLLPEANTLRPCASKRLH